VKLKQEYYGSPVSDETISSFTNFFIVDKDLQLNHVIATARFDPKTTEKSNANSESLLEDKTQSIRARITTPANLVSA